MNSKQLFGERLKGARANLGLSLRDLASEIGVTAQTLSNYERGEIMPKSPVLIELARALKVKVEYFFRQTALPSLTALEFRKKNALNVKEQNSIMATIREWLERYQQAENLFPTTNKPTISQKDITEIREEADVENEALKLRKKWNLGLAPIESMVALLEENGVRVYLMKAADSFDACTFWAGDRPGIVANEELPGDRLRFNLAHELGHLILKTPGEGNKRKREKPAMRFAGAFLVPEPVVKKELGETRSQLNLEELHLLKHKYGLSMSAWAYRAKDLGIISPALTQKFYMLFRQRGWSVTEPGIPYPQESKPSRLKQLVLRAYAESIISETKAAELLGQSLMTFRQECLNQNA